MKNDFGSMRKISSLIHQSKILETKSLSKAIVFILIILSHMQSVFLAIIGYTILPLYFRDQLAEELKQICRFMLFLVDFEIKNMGVINFIIISLTTLYLIFILALISYIFLKLQDEKPLSGRIRYMMNILKNGHSYILFLPIQNILFNLILDSFMHYENQGAIKDIFFIVLGIIGTLINSIFALAILLQTTLLKNNDKLSRMSNYNVTLMLIRKFFSSLLYYIHQYNDKKIIGWIYIIAQIFITLMETVYILTIPPYYSKKLSKIIRYANTTCLTISLWNLITLIASDTAFSLSSGHFISIAFLIPPFLMKLFESYHLSFDINLGIKALNVDFQVNQWVEFILNSKKLLDGVEINSKVKKFELKLLRDIVSYRQHQTSLKIKTNQDLAQYLTEINSSNKNLPPIVNLLIAQILIKDCNALSQGYIIANKILNLPNLSYSEHLSALNLKNLMNELIKKYHEENLELVEFMNSLRFHDRLNELVRKATTEREKFYSMLISSDEPSTYQLSLAGKNVQVLENKINKMWENLSQKAIDEYPPLVKIYGFFKIFVELRQETGRQLLIRYKKLIQKKADVLDVKGNNMYSDKNIFLTVGAEAHNIGKVLSSSFNIKKIFGRSYADIIGKNLNILMPKSIAGSHNDIMRKRLDNSEKMMTPFKIETLAMHNEGYVFPVKLLVTLFPDISEGLSFWSMITCLQNTREYLILDKAGFIEGMSRGLKDALIGDSNQKIHISTLGSIMNQKEANRLFFDYSKYQIPDSLKNTETRSMSLERLENYEKVRNQFMSLLKDQADANIEFIFSLYPDKFKRNKVSRYNCNTRKNTFNDTFVFILTLSKYQNNPIKAETKSANSIARSDEFSNITENKDPLQKLTNTQLKDSKSSNKIVESLTNIKFIKKPITEDEIIGSYPRSLSYNDDVHLDGSQNLSDKILHEKATKNYSSTLRDEHELKISLEEVVRSTNYYKFHIAKILFLGLILFIIIFFTTILYTYAKTTSSIDQVSNRMEAILHANLRGKALAIGFFYLYPLHVFTNILGMPDDFLAINCGWEFHDYFTFVIENNTLLQNSVANLTQVEIDYFFGENLRMYTSDFENIPNVTNYLMVDQFTLVRNAYSQAMHYYNNYDNIGLDSREYAMQFIFGNIMNDLWMRIIYDPTFLQLTMQSEVDDTISINEQLFIANLSFIGILILVMVVIFPKSYYDSLEFLENIINIGDSHQIENALQDLKILNAFLEKKYSSKNLSTSKNFLPKSKAKGVISKKKGKNGELFLKMVLRTIFMIVIQACPFYLIYECFSSFKITTSRIIPILSDINKMNNITFSSLSIQSILGLYLSRPQTVVMNQNIDDALEIAFTSYKSSVSVTNDFSSDTLKFLNSEYCSHYLPNTFYPDCKILFKGLGMSGIITTILEAIQYHENYKAAIMSTSLDPLTISYFAFQEQNLELISLENYGVSRAIIEYQKVLVNDLLDDLHSTSNEILILLIPSILFGVFMTLVVAWIIFKIVWQERKWIAGCLNIIPLELVMSNKDLRLYILNDSKIFHKMIKKYERIKKRSLK